MAGLISFGAEYCNKFVSYVNSINDTIKGLSKLGKETINYRVWTQSKLNIVGYLCHTLDR